MARNSTKKHETGTTITTRTPFGSHAEMIVENLGNGKVICKDDIGTYETFENRIDSGLADPARYSRTRD